MVGFAVGPLSLGFEKVQVLLPAPICCGENRNVQDTSESERVVRMTAEREVC